MGDEKDDIDSQIHQGLRTLSRRFVVEYVRSGIDYPDEDRSDSAEAMSMTYAQLKQALMALVNYIQGIITGVMWRNIGPDKFSQPMLIKINDGPESVADDWMQQILSQRSNLPDPDEATDDSILRFECTDLTSLFHQVAYQLSHSWLVEHMKEPDPDLSGDTVSQPLQEEADRSQQGAKGFADDTVIGDELDEYEEKLQEGVRDIMKVWAGVNPDTQSWDTPIRATDANLMNWLQRLGSRCVKFYSDMYTGTIANQINVDVDRQAQRFVGSLFKPKDDDPETYKVTGTNVLVLPCALETLMLAFGRELKKLMDDDA